MESIVITWRELLVVVVIILAVYIAELLLLVRSGKRVRPPRFLRALRLRRRDAALRDDLEDLQERVAALEARLAEQQMLAEQVDVPEVVVKQRAASSNVNDSGNTGSPYMRAIHMAKQGMDADFISATCGISRSEAELIIAMHGRRAA